MFGICADLTSVLTDRKSGPRISKRGYNKEVKEMDRKAQIKHELEL